MTTKSLVLRGAFGDCEEENVPLQGKARRLDDASTSVDKKTADFKIADAEKRERQTPSSPLMSIDPNTRSTSTFAGSAVSSPKRVAELHIPDLQRSYSTETWHQTLNLLLKPSEMEEVDNYGIPPETDVDCDPDLEAKFEQWMKLKAQGMHFNTRLTRTHAFRNPSIMSKMIEFQGLDEYGSNFPKDVFDPHGFPPETYVDELEKAQKLRAERGAQVALQGLPHTVPPVSHLPPAVVLAQQKAIQFMSSAAAAHQQQQQQAQKAYASSVGMYLPNQGATKRSSKWDNTSSMSKKAK
ncbi:hypothetical protein SeMB42_g04289 [Synchytrium endobioticum]|uniref:HCNGP-like protein n=1 Tax=Synchytrium endobioticum TaxID=286115 RepID=A0A507D7L9_9FUNG|nr:hypothetical protein SeMB42_g04289 [Synchytrium endobioticum]TPX47317.1 hypothetical protein SeLEV6574_g02725 [Synchytrium endobioticum]